MEMQRHTIYLDISVRHFKPFVCRLSANEIKLM